MEKRDSLVRLSIVFYNCHLENLYIELINGYLGNIITCIYSHGGDILKYAGDAIIGRRTFFSVS